MSFKALNEYDKEIYSVEKWEKNFINLTPICPVCGEVTELKAKSSVVMKTHFAHSKGTDCPSVDDNHQKYTLLPPSKIDKANGNKLISWMKVNPHLLYQRCAEPLNQKLRFQEFSDILDRAFRNNIWFYEGLTESLLPYVLIVNHGKFMKVSGMRSEEVHFVFDKSLYGDDGFLQKQITHIWRVYSNSDFDKIELRVVQDSVPHYFWKYIKSFYNK